MKIVISGASKGIGRAIAEAFAAEGHELFLCARHKQDLEQAAADMGRFFNNKKIYTYTADVSRPQDVADFAAWCLSYGVPDVLVNNAGSYVPGSVASGPNDALQQMIDINLYSMWNLTRALVPSMQQQQRGHIFNISSVAGLGAYDNGGAYSISKYAVNGLTDNLRHELKPYGIKVTNVLPGAVMTDSWAGFDNSKKRIMEATDIAAMVLASTKLSAQAVPETIILRPQLGDL